MLRRLLDLPLLVILMGIGALAMYVPAGHAVVASQHQVARPFFYGGTILLLLTLLIAIATANRRPRNVARSHLAAFLGAYAVLPVMLALPFDQAVPDTSFLNAWFEMLSSFTTTGATLYDVPERLPSSLHLWRAIVGWLGGFFILVIAVAVLAPMNLGGMEVIRGRLAAPSGTDARPTTRFADPSDRLVRYALMVLPAYGGLTLLLWGLLAIAGEGGLTAFCLALSTLSTSGIAPGPGLQDSDSGFLVEAVIFAFLLVAVTRRSLPGGMAVDPDQPFRADPEVRMAGVIVLAVTAILFLRHWVGALEQADARDVPGLFGALWGTAFTALSFLTTTGFTSDHWATSRLWSGLDSPGLILLGLSIIGGGVATTAGGVKLLRVYALFLHGKRELERLVHPSSVGGAGPTMRRLRREGAYLAWIFFMLFAISIALVTAALTLAGLEFEPALILGIAALTTNGPIAQFATETPISYSGLSEPGKVILGLTMVLGRIETIALLALLAPDSWRR